MCRICIKRGICSCCCDAVSHFLYFFIVAGGIKNKCCILCGRNAKNAIFPHAVFMPLSEGFDTPLCLIAAEITYINKHKCTYTILTICAGVCVCVCLCLKWR